MTLSQARTIKALGALLTYPDESLIAALDEIAACIEAEGLVDGATRSRLTVLFADLRGHELMAVQEQYIGLFDRSRRLSLHLYEHVHGDSRDRGQAMVNLVNLYRFHGFDPSTGELPDYLPLLCEFLSNIEWRAARSVLADATTVMEALRVRLEQRGSPYAAVFAALVMVAGQDVDVQEVQAVLAAEPEEDDSLEALDRAWEEESVSFAPGAALGSCSPNGTGRPAPLTTAA